MNSNILTVRGKYVLCDDMYTGTSDASDLPDTTNEYIGLSRSDYRK